jgi:hypothetical protein
MPTETRCLCLALAAAVTFQLFYLGAQPFAAGLIQEPWDKLVHLAVFAVLTTLHQANLPGRSADAADLFADACTATGTGIFLFLLHARRKTSERDGTTGLAAQAHTTSSQGSLGAGKTAR